ncbi:hypothetical protein AGMMS50268_13760 [Spirochaetia bacterium]|nr:hypothetical protein AGMMS50268_13760 [Spirochaetia bacterium]
MTNNKEYKEILDVKLEHGAVINSGKFDFIDYGYNYRLPELQAVMGLKQLQKLDEIISIRQIIKESYIKNLAGLGFAEQKTDRNVFHNMQSIVFKVPDNIKRDDLVKHLKENDIEATIGTYCLSDCTYYRKKYNNIQPVAKMLYDITITLPCYSGVDVELVLEKIRMYSSNEV